MLQKFQFRVLSFSVLLCVLTCSTASPLVAQEKRSGPIEPYLDSSTAFVGWLDVNQTDLPGLQAFAKKYDIQTGSMAQTANFQKALKTVGVQRVFAIASLADLSAGGPLAVLPSEPDKVDTVQLLVSTSLASEPVTVVTHGNNVLVGSNDVVNRYIMKDSAKPFASLVSEINAAEHTNAAIIRVPAAAAVFLSPVLPDLVNGLKLKNPPDIQKVGQMVMSTQTVSLSASIPPRQAKVMVEMSTKEAATETSVVINQLIREEGPESIQDLATEVKGKTVGLNLKNDQAVAAAMDLLMQILTPARMQAREVQQKNSLKQIGLAMHNFYDTYKVFPPHALASKDGKKMLSWRVLILPFLDQNQLYQQFHLDEPWDSEHNIKLVAQMPLVYAEATASEINTTDGKTRLQVPLLENSVFGRSGGGASFREITDGTSNTVMVVQVPKDKAVIWTKPNDAVVDPANPAAALVDPSQERFLAGFCDGSVRRVLATVSNKTLLALLTMNGGEIVDTDEL